MALNIDIKCILLYIYEYFLFLKEEVFSNTSKYVAVSDEPTPKFANGLRRNEEVEPFDKGTTLLTFQNDCKLQFPRDEPEVRRLLNIYGLLSWIKII